MKRLFRIILLVVLVSIAVLGVRWFENVKKNGSGTELKIFGNIDIRKADLAFNEQERIAGVLVEEGDRVSKGQVLAMLQTHRLEAQIKEAEAQIAAQQEVVRRLEAGTRPQEIAQARAELAAAKATSAKHPGPERQASRPWIMRGPSSMWTRPSSGSGKRP